MAERETADADLVRGESIEIANEFATVLVRKVQTRNGERLEIVAPREGTLIRLDPLELEAISGQDPELFTRLLQDPTTHPASPPDADQGDR